MILDKNYPKELIFTEKNMYSFLELNPNLFRLIIEITKQQVIVTVFHIEDDIIHQELTFRKQKAKNKFVEINSSMTNISFCK